MPYPSHGVLGTASVGPLVLEGQLQVPKKTKLDKPTGRWKLRHACGAFAGCLHHGLLRFPWLMGLFWAYLVPPFCALDLPETQMLL